MAFPCTLLYVLASTQPDFFTGAVSRGHDNLWFLRRELAHELAQGACNSSQDYIQGILCEFFHVMRVPDGEEVPHSYILLDVGFYQMARKEVPVLPRLCPYKPI